VDRRYDLPERLRWGQQRPSAIFTILETNSRYVYARALKAPTAAQTAAALESIIEENREEKQVAPILKLRTDGGPEFSGAFAQLLEKLDIPHEKTGAGTHERLARLDRFHGTDREKIQPRKDNSSYASIVARISTVIPFQENKNSIV